MKYLLILILFCQYVLADPELTCPIYLKSFADPTKQVALNMSTVEDRKSYADEVFKIVDPKNPINHKLLSSLTKGILTFSIRTKDAITGERPDWRATEAFDVMMKHYGSKVKKIKTAWINGDNFEDFIKAKDSGSTDEDAAFKTWTGKQALKYGFSKMEDIHIKRVAGKIEYVTATFSKP